MAEASSGGQCMRTLGCGLQPNNPRTTNRQTVPLPLFSRPAFTCSVSTCGLCPDRFHETGNQAWPRQKGKRRCYGQTKNPRERLRGKDGVQNLHISLHTFTLLDNNYLHQQSVTRIRIALKIRWSQGRVGSTPSSGTKFVSAVEPIRNISLNCYAPAAIRKP
jgi:hypothetical protein